jgi:opacity protein-like surface antigen
VSLSARAQAAAQPRATGIDLGVSFGAIGRTDTFDDGYKTGGTPLYVDASAGILHPLRGTFFTGAGVHLLFPFKSATVDTTVTKLDTTGIVEGMFGAPVDIGDHAVNVWATFGGAIGAVQSGYTSPTYSYSDTETLKGITVSFGASTALSSQVALTTEIRYLDLFSGTFGTPGGN